MKNKNNRSNHVRQRKLNEKKPIRKGVKSMRNQPEIYDELKKIVSFSITPTANSGLAKISEKLCISKSELIERIGRNLLTISKVKTDNQSDTTSS
ncbi:hypothetical protein [Nostoc parmelioides]|nr:hypothetical protein [Nostoc parmelioides]